MKEIKVEAKEPIRINTFLRNAGVASRRSIDDYISKGYISINNKLASLGSKVVRGDIVTIKELKKDLKYALYYKPRGEVTGPLQDLPGCVPVGRLDKESEGLLLYSNDFRVIDALLNPLFKREKEYEVNIREKATPRVITLLKKGITTQEQTYAPVKAVQIYNEGYSLRIILTEGKKHEIRRMLNALNLTITSLKRVRIMSFVLRGMSPKKIYVLHKNQVESFLKDLGLLSETPKKSE